MQPSRKQIGCCGIASIGPSPIRECVHDACQVVRCRNEAHVRAPCRHATTAIRLVLSMRPRMRYTSLLPTKVLRSDRCSDRRACHRAGNTTCELANEDNAGIPGTGTKPCFSDQRQRQRLWVRGVPSTRRSNARSACGGLRRSCGQLPAASSPCALIACRLICPRRAVTARCALERRSSPSRMDEGVPRPAAWPAGTTPDTWRRYGCRYSSVQSRRVSL